MQSSWLLHFKSLLSSLGFAEPSAHQCSTPAVSGQSALFLPLAFHFLNWALHTARVDSMEVWMRPRAHHHGAPGWSESGVWVVLDGNTNGLKQEDEQMYLPLLSGRAGVYFGDMRPGLDTAGICSGSVSVSLWAPVSLSSAFPLGLIMLWQRSIHTERHEQKEEKVSFSQLENFWERPLSRLICDTRQKLVPAHLGDPQPLWLVWGLLPQE